MRVHLFTYLVFLKMTAYGSYSAVDGKPINGKPDTISIKALIEKGKQLRKSGEIDSACIYFDSALRLSKKIKYANGQGYAHYNMALAYKSLGKYYLSIAMLDSAIYQIGKIKDKKLQVLSLTEKGVVLQKMGKYTQALRIQFKALKTIEKRKQFSETARVIVNIASIYDDLKNYDKALEYYFKAIPLLKSAGNETGLSVCYTNMVATYVNKKKYHDAMKYQLMSLELEKKLQLEMDIAASYSNIGSIYGYMKDYPNAVKYQLMALELRKKMDNKVSLEISLSNIGAVYMDMGQLKKAEEYTKQALRMATDIEDWEGISKTHMNLATIYERMNLPGKAYPHFIKYISVRDSLVNLDKIRESERIALNYEFEKKTLRQKIIQQKKDAIAKEKVKTRDAQLSRNRFLIIGLIVFILMGVVIARLLIKQNRYKLTQQNLELQQQMLRSQMNPHFIFNSINSIQGYILKKNEEQAYDYLAKFSKLIRIVLNYTFEKTIPLKQELEMLSLYVELEQMRFEKSFDFHITIDENVDEFEIDVPGMFVQPYIENAIWHGLMNIESEKKGVIQLHVSANKKVLKIVIEDNGVGRELSQTFKSKATHNPVGMKLTAERLANINKQLDSKNAKVVVTDLYDNYAKATGTRVEIYLPIE